MDGLFGCDDLLWEKNSWSRIDNVAMKLSAMIAYEFSLWLIYSIYISPQNMKIRIGDGIV